MAIFIPLDYFNINTSSAIIVTTFTGIIAVYAQSIRQLNIINVSKRNLTFIRDIIFFVVSLLILLIFTIYLQELFIYYIFTTTVSSMIIYLWYFNPIKYFKLHNV